MEEDGANNSQDILEENQVSVSSRQKLIGQWYLAESL